ncbi:MAG: arginine--tRNA ligase, partial [Lachnospiraceae bacterium]|nr:arginine--tRNA ligase [Lachnospiraceae bacterium]
VSELEEIYPFASARSKEDPEYYREAMEYTHRLQNREAGLFALWLKIVEVSTKDMRRNYERLHVSFELWNGESTVQDRIAPMVQEMKDKGLAVMSDGALIVDVAEESDARTIPPCMILKSDGAALYTTTDLATIVDREEKIAPDEIIYVTDKRQELHFTQVFRCARKCGLLPESTGLTHIGFGTVNGRNGLALKTREGGVMRLETLIDDIDAAMLEKIRTNPEIPEDEAVQTARQVALAALKYGDLSNQASKDYIFDLDKFISFEGDTGPYILYTIVRMQSILRKYEDGKKNGGDGRILPAKSAEEKRLMLTVASFPEAVRQARSELSPTRICAYIYALANDCNSFYHTTKILSEEDEARKAGWIALIRLANRILSTGIELLGFTAPERM